MKARSAWAAAFAVLLLELSVFFASSAWAVPSYSRRYGVECSTCHTMWGALNGGGISFRLSGYRAIFGRDLTPISEDIELNKAVALPTTLAVAWCERGRGDSSPPSRQQCR
jgi:hypothetical protein